MLKSVRCEISVLTILKVYSGVREEDAEEGKKEEDEEKQTRMIKVAYWLPQ